MFFHDLNLPDTYMISPKSGVVHHQAKVFQSFIPLERGKLIKKRAQEETVLSTHQPRYCDHNCEGCEDVPSAFN